MTPRFSLYLDALRFLAALIVFVSHFAYPRFTGGDYIIIRDLNLGSDAVVFFFVLSGLVIAYTAEVKDKTLGQYSFHRLTRLYSVIVPALILTVALDHWGQHIAPEKYDGWWYYPAPAWEQLLRGFGLTYQWAFQDFRIGTNGPMWSLSYEAAYYILFGFVFYLQGWKRWLLLTLFLPLVGLSVLALLPVWLTGIWVYKQIRTPQNIHPHQAWLCVVVPPVLYAVFLFIKLPLILLGLTKLLFSVDFVDHALHFSDEFVWNLIIAQLVAFHLIGMAALYRQSEKAGQGSGALFIRWCAGATFTLYVVHYPALQFMDAVLPAEWPVIARHSALLISVLFGCFIFAEVSERRLKAFRKLFKKT